MTFDIHQLDEIDSYDDQAEQALEDYQDALLELFFDSPEGEARLQADPEMGFWAAQLMHYGYGYIGVTLPQMTARNVEEIVTELFPRKISLLSPDDADDAIPELVAFWEYLKREYKLPSANSVLRFLHEIESDFKEIMNDPARFGMAKSFFMMGQAAGFDMAKEEEINAFMHLYNASLLAQDEGLSGLYPGLPASSDAPQAEAKKKKRRKMAKAARRRSRKRRR